MSVEGYCSPGGMGGPAILPLSMAKMAQMTKAFPDKEFSGIGGVSTFDHALNYFLLGCGTVQVCTAAMLDHAIGPNVIKALTTGMSEFMDKRGYASLSDFRGLRRDRVVSHSQIKRPDTVDYHGGYEEEQEGYAKPEVAEAAGPRAKG
jgi:dihydropyrimidine dehydrogenase (NAD+) subunit PreA